MSDKLQGKLRSDSLNMSDFKRKQTFLMEILGFYPKEAGNPSMLLIVLKLTLHDFGHN